MTPSWDAGDLAVIDAMEREGGSFVASLAQAFRHADAENFEKLKAAFPEYWTEYAGVAFARARRAGTPAPKSETGGG